MSTVYTARDLRFSHVERLCAIKEMQVDAPDNKTRVLRISNFEREAEMLATLSHPSIPKIFDYFNADGLVYLVLEFIEGQDLESFIENSDEPVEESVLLNWTLQMLDVLTYLHEHEPEPIVFRDLKPSNIMLRPDGKIVLIDFGIARTFQPLIKGTMIGTEGYAPPEQYRGISEPRGDLYALGATMHHLVTRSDPRNETPFTFEQRPARSFNPEISQELEAIINRALAYSASDRFPSARTMAEAIHSVVEGDRVRDDGALRAMLTSNLTTAIRHPTIKQDEKLAGTPPAPESYQEAVLQNQRAEPLERLLWSIQTGDEVRGSARIHNQRAYIGSYDGYVYSILIKDGSLLWRYRTNRGVITRPEVARDVIYFGSEDQHLYAVRERSGRLAWSFRAAMPVRSSAVYFNDTIIFGADDTYCYAVDSHDGTLVWRQRAWGPIRSSPSVHGNNVIFGADDGALYKIDAVDGRLIWRRSMGRRILSSPAIEDDVVVVGGFDGSIIGVDYRTGDTIWKHQTHGPILSSPRLLGSTIYIGSTDGAIYALNLTGGDEIWKSQIANQITSTITINGGYGYVGTIDGFVHCLNLKDGETVWRHRVGGPVTSTPAIAEETVIVGCLDGHVYGLRI